MIKVFTVPLNEDLTEFTQFLWQYEVPHRVLEKGDFQEFWVEPNVNPEDILALYEMWKNGGELSQMEFRAQPTPAFELSAAVQPSFFVLAQRAWFSTSLIVISIVLSFLIGFGENFDLLRHFTITELLQKSDGIYTSGLMGTVESMEYWRFITPIFLHFSAAHIVFNVLWIWIAGTRIESAQGRLSIVMLVLISGVASNLAQYWVSGPMFGGLSGVVFAFLGYCWLWDRLYSPKLRLPPALMGFMVFWLALGYSGILSSVGFGSIANTAHLAGLVTGLIFVPLGKRLAKA